MYSCNYCNQTFSNSSNRNKHLKTCWKKDCPNKFGCKLKISLKPKNLLNIQKNNECSNNHNFSDINDNKIIQSQTEIALKEKIDVLEKQLLITKNKVDDLENIINTQLLIGKKYLTSKKSVKTNGTLISDMIKV